jgi:hypothetical protein
MGRYVDENPTLALLGFPLVLFYVFGPIYAAAWFFRFCERLARRGQSGEEENCRAKTQATHWLVGLGAFLMMLPMIGMVFVFNSAALSPTRTTVSEASIDNLLLGTIGATLVGGLLLFLGLVRRRPIPQRTETTAPSEMT